MPRLSMRSHSNPLLFGINKSTTLLLAYSLIIFFIGLGDSVMSYFSPVFISENTSTPFAMGIILATSSMVGMMADFTMGNRLGHKKFTFFLFVSICGAILFPLMYFVPYSLPQILIAMAIWGIYYECKLFSNFHAVHTMVSKERHATAWGIITTFQAAAYFCGPILAVLLIEKGLATALGGVISIQIVALFGALILLINVRRRRHTTYQVVAKKTVIHEIKTWRVLGRRLWPMLLFAFVLAMVDATFLNIGALFSESVRHESPIGGYLITIYLLPGLFMGLFAGKASQRFGKKRTAFITAIIAGLILGIAGLIPSVEIFVMLVFIAAIFLAIALPETMAVFEDYIARLGHDASDLIGLENSFTSLSFVVGPILSGLVATFIGYQKTFSVFGLLLAFTAGALLYVVPRKIRLPQKQLHEVEQSIQT